MITPAQSSERIIHFIDSIEVIPVLIIDDATVAADLAKLLVDSGFPIFEVVLRTPAALDAIEQMANIEDAIVAAGTVLTKQDIECSKSAGAKFIVSPGSSTSLINAAASANIPLLPGAATASEMMNLSEHGFSFLKFFPANTSGGAPALRAFSSALSHLSFCPTGGINIDNLNEYLNQPNVICAGGSWLVTREDLKNKNWTRIAEKLREVKTTYLG